ncbi:MAG: cysteine hydrolase family protein [Pseudanabaenales cyanobacterium]|nr:cysteine hydrolase family protein [Pseudanabaenales cyanobacterium]
MSVIAAQAYDYPLPPDRRRLALLIIDMQRDFLEPGGFGEALGNEVSRLLAIVPAVKQLQAAFRARGLMVIQTQEGHQPDLSDCPPSKRERGRGKLKIGDQGPMGRKCLRQRQ